MATLPASVVLPRPWPLLRLLPVRLHRLLAPCAPVRTLLLACRRRPLPALAVAPPAPAASWTPLRSPRGSPSHHLTPSVRRLLRRQGWNGPLEMQPWAYPPIPGLASAAARWMDLVLVSSFSFLHHWCFFLRLWVDLEQRTAPPSVWVPVSPQRPHPLPCNTGA